MRASRCYALLLFMWCNCVAASPAIIASTGTSTAPAPQTSVFTHPSPSASVSGQQAPSYTAPARQHLENVFAQPEFSRTTTTTKLRSKNKEKEPEKKNNDSFFLNFIEGLLPYFTWLAQALAQIAEIALWLCALGVAGLIIKYRQHWLKFIGRISRKPQPPQTAASVNTPQPLEEAPLPANVPHAVSALWQRGDKTGALSLLYRATLQGLDTSYHLTLCAGATEMDALRAIPADQPLLHAYLSKLITHWQRMAYANRFPETTGAIEELVEGYRRHFEQNEQNFRQKPL